ncbi:MAG: chemotaxis protein CheW [Lamprobacter sp.]|uniref:chemotaxis protein CheW n=1 Tax=Lamprobacter sp. TaxID=3100796 RepID=UPI002B256DDA|nr:chemotaxis protein CheW [Lamprobacter sp.]MEA3640158.1 chemotaxis protein CheW [Lamprobacter sp.]
MISAERRAIPISGSPWLELAQECVVFALGAQTYAVAAERLRTCLSLPRLTALEDTPPYLVGAFDLRGELAPVVSPPVLGGAPLQPAASGDVLIVVDAGGYPLGLHADTLLGIEPLCAQPWERCASSAGVLQISLSGGQARLIDPSLIGLVAESSGWTEQSATQSADERLQQFERELDAAALLLLETRAERYRSLARVDDCLTLVLDSGYL